MNEKLKIVQSMQQLANTIAETERKLKLLKNTDVKFVDSISIEYAIPSGMKFTSSKAYEDVKMQKVIFATPNGHNAEKIVDYIKRVYESELAKSYEVLEKYAEMLKNAPSGATNTEQGNATD